MAPSNRLHRARTQNPHDDCLEAPCPRATQTDRPSIALLTSRLRLHISQPLQGRREALDFRVQFRLARAGFGNSLGLGALHEARV